MKNKIIFPFVIVLASVLSAIFFFVLFSSIRCEADDWAAGINFRTNSLLETYKNTYWLDTLRPMSILLSYIGVGIISNTNYYPITILLLFVTITGLFVCFIYKLLQEVFSFDKPTSFYKPLLICFSLLLVMSLYFMTTNRLEIFGWMSASINHLVPVVFVFLVAYILIKPYKKLDYFYLSLSVFFIGGAAEYVASSVLAVISICCLLFFYRKENKRQEFQKHKEFFFRLAFFSFVLALFFLFTVITPGAWLRYNNTQQYVKVHSPERSLEILNTIKLLFRPYKLMGFAFLFFIWLFFIQIFQVKLKTSIHWKYLVASLISVVLVTSVFCVVCYNTLKIDRMWFVLDTTFFIVASILMLQFLSDKNLSKVFTYSGIIYIIGLMIFFNARHTPALLNFSTEHDKIISYLQKQKEGEIAVVDSFPPHDLITQARLTSDPEDSFNIAFCKFYGIKAKVVVKHPYNE
ncbi:MAG TPA: DUF6056 family protein [Bacteroidia bacterium]|nr:DUF6056 family protein [Bacteroidia bacterium]